MIVFPAFAALHGRALAFAGFLFFADTLGRVTFATTGAVNFAAGLADHLLVTALRLHRRAFAGTCFCFIAHTLLATAFLVAMIVFPAFAAFHGRALAFTGFLFLADALGRVTLAAAGAVVCRAGLPAVHLLARALAAVTALVFPMLSMMAAEFLAGTRAIFVTDRLVAVLWARLCCDHRGFGFGGNTQSGLDFRRLGFQFSEFLLLGFCQIGLLGKNHDLCLQFLQRANLISKDVCLLGEARNRTKQTKNEDRQPF